MEQKKKFFAILIGIFILFLVNNSIGNPASPLGACCYDEFSICVNDYAVVYDAYWNPNVDVCIGPL